MVHNMLAGRLISSLLFGSVVARTPRGHPAYEENVWAIAWICVLSVP